MTINLPRWSGILLLCAIVALVAWANSCGRDPAFAQPLQSMAGECYPGPIASQIGRGGEGPPADFLTLTGIVTPAGTGEDGYFAIGQDDTWMTKSARFALWLTGQTGKRIRITAEAVR